MEDRFVITRLDQLRAMADPLRVRIVEALTRGERTVADLAARVGEPAGKLYHHVDLLLEAGLIRVSRRVRKRGAEERWLRAVARDVVVDDRIFAVEDDGAEDPAALVEVGRAFLAAVGDELAGAATAGAIEQSDPGRRVFLEQQQLELTPAQYRKLTASLDQWITAARASRRGAGSRSYRFAVTMFPLAAPAGPAPGRKKRGTDR